MRHISFLSLIILLSVLRISFTLSCEKFNIVSWFNFECNFTLYSADVHLYQWVIISFNISCFFIIQSKRCKYLIQNTICLGDRNSSFRVVPDILNLLFWRFFIYFYVYIYLIRFLYTCFEIFRSTQTINSPSSLAKCIFRCIRSFYLRKYRNLFGNNILIRFSWIYQIRN